MRITSSIPRHLKMPETSYIDGTEPFENDAAVLAALDVAWKLPGDDLMGCEVGMRNNGGEVYRRASIRGVAQMLYLEERMEQLGFVPELEDSEHHGSGFDIIFRRAAKSSRLMDGLLANLRIRAVRRWPLPVAMPLRQQTLFTRLKNSLRAA